MTFHWLTLPAALVAGTIVCPQDTVTGREPVAQPDRPRLVIESFGSASAYAVGSQSIMLVGTIRNTGREASPAGTYTARIYALAGLDYTEGDTMPKVPALEPNATATFRWRLMPSSADSPLVASLALELPGRMPESRVAAIQHFTESPPAESAGFSKAATARANHSSALLENAGVRVRVFTSDANVPVLIMSSRTSTGWRRVGATLPLAEVMSAEGGQRPWWEVFRAESTRASVMKGTASLVLTGGFGIRWRGTVILTLRTDSSVVDARLLLAPQKTVKLSAVRFLPFYVGDGSFGSAAAEALSPEAAMGPISAVRWGAITVGTTWREEATNGEWRATPLQSPDGTDYRLLGAEWQPNGPPPVLSQASLVEWRTRLFALTPSVSVTDARRVARPAQPMANAVTRK